MSRRRAAGPLLVTALVLATPTLTACTATQDPGSPGPAGSSDSPGDAVRRSASPVHPPTTPVSSGSSPAVVDPAAPVGALFGDGLGSPHSCTASVVDTAAGDVVMTAAHCVSGTGTGLLFVPGYDQGRMPYGAFAVTGAYVPAGWTDDRDEDDDIAFLTVAPDAQGRQVQSLTGAATLRTGAAADGQRVTITAYDDGIDDSPVQCTAVVRDVAKQPTIECHGFTAGSSGSAWLLHEDGRTVAVGLIGGLHQGGCEEYTSYSPSLGVDVEDALRAAATGAPGETLPTPPDDGC